MASCTYSEEKKLLIYKYLKKEVFKILKCDDKLSERMRGMPLIKRGKEIFEDIVDNKILTKKNLKDDASE